MARSLPDTFPAKATNCGGKPRGHQYGDKLLKIVEAREDLPRGL